MKLLAPLLPLDPHPLILRLPLLLRNLGLLLSRLPNFFGDHHPVAPVLAKAMLSRHALHLILPVLVKVSRDTVRKLVHQSGDMHDVLVQTDNDKHQLLALARREVLGHEDSQLGLRAGVVLLLTMLHQRIPGVGVGEMLALARFVGGVPAVLVDGLLGLDAIAAGLDGALVVDDGDVEILADTREEAELGVALGVLLRVVAAEVHDSLLDTHREKYLLRKGESFCCWID